MNTEFIPNHDARMDPDQEEATCPICQSTTYLPEPADRHPEDAPIYPYCSDECHETDRLLADIERMADAHGFDHSPCNRFLPLIRRHLLGLTMTLANKRFG